MTGQIDLSQKFYGWNLDATEPEANETPYKPGSLEEYFWPKYRELFKQIIETHGQDPEGLTWHKSCLRIIMQELSEMIVKADKASVK